LEGRGFAPEWYQSEYIIDFYRKSSRLISARGIRNVNTMRPRRCDEPPVAKKAMEREMRELRSRLDAMETNQRRVLDVGDVSKATIEEVEAKEVVVEDAMKEHLLKAVFKLGARAKINVPMYEGNLDTE